MIDQEKIYQLIFNKGWGDLIRIIFDNKELIKEDTLLQESLKTALEQIVQESINSNISFEFRETLEYVHMLNRNNHISLDSNQEAVIISALISSNRANLDYCYNYAISRPDIPLCNEIIEFHEADLPQEIDHSQEQNVTITVNKLEKEQRDLRIELFKSQQETEFYLALKRVFPTYQIYPNVALSSVLCFEVLKNILSKNECDFFLRSSVDFVVFEPFKNYLPVYFFEIDSIWHDSNNQKEKDKTKDKIFSLSGQKLYRIRKINECITEKEFEKLLIEIRAEIESK